MLPHGTTTARLYCQDILFKHNINTHSRWLFVFF
jgi:hypothetical protein